jgi:hypothetical protein
LLRTQTGDLVDPEGSKISRFDRAHLV